MKTITKPLAQLLITIVSNVRMGSHIEEQLKTTPITEAILNVFPVADVLPIVPESTIALTSLLLEMGVVSDEQIQHTASALDDFERGSKLVKLFSLEEGHGEEQFHKMVSDAMVTFVMADMGASPIDTMKSVLAKHTPKTYAKQADAMHAADKITPNISRLLGALGAVLGGLMPTDDTRSNKAEDKAEGQAEAVGPHGPGCHCKHG